MGEPGNTEGVTAVLERPNSERDHKPEVREEWFQAYVKGNGLLPQTEIALNFYVLDSVLEDPPESWEEFRASKLSSEQITRLGQLMTNMHKSRGINRGHNRPGEMGGASVSSERLQELWEGPRTAVFNFLINATGVYPTHHYSRFEQELAVERLFEDRDKIARIKDVARAAVSALESPVTKQLAENYKHTYDQKKPLGDRLQEDAGLDQTIKEAGIDTESRYVAAEARRMFLGDIQKIIISRMHQADPEMARSAEYLV
jgi:hypothetical protein